MCVAWGPKGLEAEVTFNQPCIVAGGEGGSFSTCNATATAVASDSIAFCVDPSVKGGFRAVECPGARPFVPVAETTCEPKSDHDQESATGAAHENDKHDVGGGCTQRIVLKAQCADCCVGVGTGVCVDVTPFEFDGQVVAETGGGEAPVLGGGLAPAQAGQECPPNSPVCTVNQHCTINPKKLSPLAFTPGDPIPPIKQKYQCDLTCVGAECPPPVCEGPACCTGPECG